MPLVLGLSLSKMGGWKGFGSEELLASDMLLVVGRIVGDQAEGSGLDGADN